MTQPYIIVPPQGSDQADEWMKLGVEKQSQGQLPDAQRYYNQALRLDPRHALATQNLAIVFAQSNMLNEALLTIERAAMLDGVHGVIQMNWALMALEAEQMDVALKTAKHGVAIAPNVETRMALAMVLATAGNPEQAVPLYNEILKEKPDHPAAGPNSCFVQTLTTATPAELRAQRDKWYAANHYKGEKKPHLNDKTLDRRLRIGYVSGDFKCHSAAMIFAAVLLKHSQDVELYLYSSLAVDEKADAKTKQFKDRAGDKWRDISTLDDEKAEAMIRADKIDILVDLAGHTNGGRLALFTRKPAPIQVTAWGFAHGTGCPEIDYFFADPVAVQQEERQYYAEKIFDLPCIVTYEPPAYDISGKSALPYHKNDYITFGSYARYEKLSDDCLATFANILRRIPESRLEFKDHGFRRPYSIRRVQAAMPDIAPERLLFSIGTSHQEHLQTYQQADIILDPFPHVGGVVGLEQLYMGLPIITLYGTQAAGRTTSSVLTAIGRTDWIARTHAEYVERAVALAGDIPTLTKVRKTLRQELLDSPVVKDYVVAVEKAYRDMWLKWCA
ncbi:MAG TPA: tetratricopeptide repeat protein [Pyrinomonadaceae bacterium]|nr:tetratricopeptide repeat protein [Pyrinomonadaceae bacterium]HLE64185.1 tetratricopeptide repeat protein [Pyrinomonadaceae bacterium]